MARGEFILLVLSCFGWFPISYFMVYLFKILLLFIKKIDMRFDGNGIVASLEDVYRTENASRLKSVDEKFYYSKLIKLSTTKNKSYRQRVADLKSVEEFHLPTSEYLLDLLSCVLKNQSMTEHEMRYEVISYYLQVERDLRNKNLLWSICLATLAAALYVFIAQIPDLLSTLQLLLLLLLWVSFAILAFFILKHKLKTTVFASFWVFSLTLLYLAAYSFCFHVMVPPAYLDQDGIRVKYPVWLTSSDIPEKPTKDDCGKSVTLMPIDDGTSSPKYNVIISPSPDTVLYTEGCSQLPSSETILAGALSKNVFRYYASPKDKTNLYTQKDLGVHLQFDTNRIMTIKLLLEHPIWYWSRILFVGWIGVVFVSGLFSGISQYFKDKGLEVLKGESA